MLYFHSFPGTRFQNFPVTYFHSFVVSPIVKLLLRTFPHEYINMVAQVGIQKFTHFNPHAAGTLLSAGCPSRKLSFSVPSASLSVYSGISQCQLSHVTHTATVLCKSKKCTLSQEGALKHIKESSPIKAVHIVQLFRGISIVVSTCHSRGVDYILCIRSRPLFALSSTYYSALLWGQKYLRFLF